MRRLLQLIVNRGAASVAAPAVSAPLPAVPRLGAMSRTRAGRPALGAADIRHMVLTAYPANGPWPRVTVGAFLAAVNAQVAA